MMLDDVPEIGALERLCFRAPWSVETYLHELKHNPRAFYYVLRPAAGLSLPAILAYGGYWLLGDEAHIVTIASHPELRRRQLGNIMLLHLIERTRQAGIIDVTLEVRRGSTAAQGLYAKWGFVEVGLRKRYYRDNNEDALLLTLFGVQNETVWQPMAAALDSLENNLSPTDIQTEIDPSAPPFSA